MLRTGGSYCDKYYNWVDQTGALTRFDLPSSANEALGGYADEKVLHSLVECRKLI
jgi:hypothetical protein